MILKNDIMKRIDEFETKLEELLNDFADIPAEEIADSLEYYENQYRRLAERE